MHVVIWRHLVDGVGIKHLGQQRHLDCLLSRTAWVWRGEEDGFHSPLTTNTRVVNVGTHTKSSAASGEHSGPWRGPVWTACSGSIWYWAYTKASGGGVHTTPVGLGNLWAQSKLRGLTHGLLQMSREVNRVSPLIRYTSLFAFWEVEITDSHLMRFYEVKSCEHVSRQPGEDEGHTSTKILCKRSNAKRLIQIRCSQSDFFSSLARYLCQIFSLQIKMLATARSVLSASQVVLVVFLLGTCTWINTFGLWPAPWETSLAAWGF